MQGQTIKRAPARGLARGKARWAVAGAAGAAAVTLAACGTAGAATAARSGTATALSYYAFDINNGSTDPGFIPVPGTDPSGFAQGDELIINDQVTTTHKAGTGYPIVGHDSGVCTLTRIPEPHAHQTLANCVVTVVLSHGSLTVQGALGFQAQQPEPAVLAVTGGAGRFDGAKGTVAVSFTKNFKVLTIRLR